MSYHHPPRIGSIADIFQTLIEQTRSQDVITLGFIVDTLGRRAFGLAFLIFALPSILPVAAIPGVAAFVSIPMSLFSIEMILGFDHFWLPKKLMQRQIPKEKFINMLQKGVPYLRKFERLIKPRLLLLTGFIGERIVGLVLLVLSLLLMLPIPFSNFFLGLLIAFLAMGLIERDGLLILAGIIGTVIFVGFYSVFLVALVKAIFKINW
jgi:hypothetical protein